MADTAVTIARNRSTPLAIQEQAGQGYNVRYKVLYSDIAYGTGSTDTVTMTLGSTPTGWYVDHALGRVTTAFAGTTAITAQVGTTSSTAAFISAQDIKAAATLEQTTTLPVLTNATTTTSLSMVAVFTNADGGSPSALSAGELDIYLRVVPFAALT